MSTDSTTPTTEPNSTIHHTDLTTFKLDLIAVCARLETSRGHVHGLAIKDGVEEIRSEEINHGRVYPNLDDLDSLGLIEKHEQEVDARTNAYTVTPRGFQLLAERRDHLARAVDGGA